MTLKELATLGRDMRAAQNKFFKLTGGTKEKYEALEESRRLEKEFDRAVREALEPPSLFGEGI